MIVSDRLLTVLQQYLKIQQPAFPLAKLRDTAAVREPGVTQLVLDADQPEEHEGMHGVFEVDVEIMVLAHAKDLAPMERRLLLGDLLETFGDFAGVQAFANDADELRGISAHGFHLFDLVVLDGQWEVEGEELVGRVMLRVTCMGQDRT